ncbi:hypothetical protein NEMBOFW57_005818 [Staphylotrichum longicolle]|uniref:Uncharacterized protein n=1 Tax=Staphylotrichum longicolle TaxID=669026 RepID=A0AAD4F0Y4_9PEZI|nr:hypothetical protein NEMBOFW57_005818 [Staphylotrichum longicolle]
METPIQLSFPLPRSLDARIYLHLTVKSKAILLFLTTASMEEASSATPLGSFVYALPDRYNPSQPLSTALCTVEPTLEFTTRLAKLLARKTQRPTYVGNSISFASTGLGGTVEEEMDAFKKVVEVTLSQLQPILESTQSRANGAGTE